MPLFTDEMLDGIRDDLAATLKESAHELLVGAANDLQVYVIAISNDMARSLVLPKERREKLMEELVAQLAAIGEVNRIRATQAAWKTFQKVVQIASNVLMSVATHAAKAI